ncbi:MAG: hypothetical protein ACOX51_07180 [Myxococcota bacterium]|jgi:hypothetical protein
MDSRTSGGDVAQGISILLAGDVNCEGSGDSYTITVRYQKAGRDWTMNGEIAIINRNPTGWELVVMTSPYFWGDDWRSKPYVLTADSFSEIAQFIVETFRPRMHDGILSVPG